LDQAIQDATKALELFQPPVEANQAARAKAMIRSILGLRYNNQGAQIGQVFAYWAIDCFGQFLEHYRSS
jgi:hypothetical protein